MKNEKLIAISLSPELLLTMDTEELKSLLGEDFARMKDYSQNNPHHCYDLLEHTVKTVQSLACSELDSDDTVRLRIAALFHDIGKPQVAFEKNGRTVFYNHARESVGIARRELEKSGIDTEELNRILFYIEYHDAFISFRCADDIKDKSNSWLIPIEKNTVEKKISSIQNTCKKNGSFIPTHKDFALLMKLCIADAAAQSEQVIQNGSVIDSRSSKINRVKNILKLIEMT